MQVSGEMLELGECRLPLAIRDLARRVTSWVAGERSRGQSAVILPVSRQDIGADTAGITSGIARRRSG